MALACRTAGGNAVRAGFDQPFDLGRHLLQRELPASIEGCRHGRDHTRRPLGHYVAPSFQIVDLYPALQDNYWPSWMSTRSSDRCLMSPIAERRPQNYFGGERRTRMIHTLKHDVAAADDGVKSLVKVVRI